MFRLKEEQVPNPRGKGKNGWQLEELKEASWNAENEGERGIV